MFHGLVISLGQKILSFLQILTTERVGFATNAKFLATFLKPIFSSYLLPMCEKGRVNDSNVNVVAEPLYIYAKEYQEYDFYLQRLR